MHLLARPSAGETDETTGEISADLVCPQCPLFRTKPGNEPLRIAVAKYFAMEHEEEVNNGYRFGSPDALTPLQWASVRGLSRGRAKFDEWLDARRKSEAESAPK